MKYWQLVAHHIVCEVFDECVSVGCSYNEYTGQDHDGFPSGHAASQCAATTQHGIADRRSRLSAG